MLEGEFARVRQGSYGKRVISNGASHITVLQEIERP
jgi:hypothetical protein